MLYDFEHQVLIGTVLGGSSLIKPPRGKNYYLSMRNKNDLWLKYKMAEMPTYFKNPVLNFYSGTYRCNSSCNETLTSLKEHLYEGNKRTIKSEILDSLWDIALAIWFLDGGSKTGRGKKNAYINTTKFGKEGTQIVLDYFNSLGMTCNVNKDANRFKVLFTVEGTIKFLKTIAHRFPTFMYYRL